MPRRPIEAIQADLDKAKASLREMMPLIEDDDRKVRESAEVIAKAKKAWAASHDRDEPFDPRQFAPPLVPFKPDAERQAAFHRQHYRIADWEAELAAARKELAGE